MAVTDEAPRHLTADEFFALPGEQSHTQLIDGEIVVNTPSTRHQDIVLWLASELLAISRAHPELGRPGLELDTPIDEDNVYAPDVWWAAPGRSPGPQRFSVAPDLVVEVRSPRTWAFDQGAKKDGYEAVGVAELWLVDTEADRVIVHRRSTADAAAFDVTFEVAPSDELTTPIIPGLTLDIGELFDR